VTAPSRSQPSPAGDRLFVLQGIRLLIVAAMLVVPAITGDFTRGLIGLAFVTLLLAAVVEVVRRVAPEHARTLLSWSVLVDGVVVVLAVALTGGYRSPLLFLVFLDVVAVTLVASYRTGIKLALWCALLLLLAHAAVDAGVFEATSPVVSDRVAIVGAATFLLFAACTALFSSVNERSLRNNRAQLESLVTLGGELERTRRADDIMSTLVEHTCGRLGFTRAAVLVRRDGHWEGVGDDGVTEMLVEIPDRSAPLVWETLNTASPRLVRTLDDDLLDDVLPGATNVVVVPVGADGEDLGVAVGEWGGDNEARIPMLTVQAFVQAATQTALALRNAALLDEVERLATRDALTGLANRRLFDESLRREAARSSRLGMPLSLLVMDVDHFKQVNDTYGHQSGDAVLREVADAIVTHTKSFDVAARYGGDEFVVLLPNCAGVDAVRVADRVRAHIARSVQLVPVTMSAGVATMPVNALDGERLVAAADAALYDAKRNGRDCTWASTRAPEPVIEEGRVWKPTLARGA
jgi:two-component system, cell cycle response regulator